MSLDGGHTGSDEELESTQAIKHSSSDESKSLGSNCRSFLNPGGFRWKRQKSDSFSSTPPSTLMPTCRLDPFKYHGYRRGRSLMGAFREPFARILYSTPNIRRPNHCCIALGIDTCIYCQSLTLFDKQLKYGVSGTEEHVFDFLSPPTCVCDDYIPLLQMLR